MKRAPDAARRLAAYDAAEERSERAPGMRHCMSWPTRGQVAEQFWFKAGHLVEYRRRALEPRPGQPEEAES